MLEKVVSSYFVKIVFSYVNEKKKLKLVKYNKILQGKIDINIINYMHFLEKYKIYESNGNGKEYDKFDRLIFEGEYINGDVKFDGEYVNGERNGKGKEYLNGVLQFECEYLNNNRNGKGKKYYWYGQ